MTNILMDLPFAINHSLMSLLTTQFPFRISKMTKDLC